MIASEYGYTIDQFLDLTMRQLQAFIERIRIRSITKEYHRSALLVKLHRGEIAPLEDILSGVTSNEGFSPEEEEKFARIAEQRLKLRREKWQAKKS